MHLDEYTPPDTSTTPPALRIGGMLSGTTSCACGRHNTEAAGRVHALDADWLAPPLWRSEFLNVLVLCLRKELLDAAKAHALFSNARTLLHEAEPAPDPVLDMAVKYGVSGYDAAFVVLAETRAIPLVTSDRRLRAACPHVAVLSEDFIDSH